jgi:uncharacterized membrane protein YfcA
MCIFLIIGSIFGAKIAHIIPLAILKKSFGLLMGVSSV